MGALTAVEIGGAHSMSQHAASRYWLGYEFVNSMEDKLSPERLSARFSGTTRPVAVCWPGLAAHRFSLRATTPLLNRVSLLRNSDQQKQSGGFLFQVTTWCSLAIRESKRGTTNTSLPRLECPPDYLCLVTGHPINSYAADDTCFHLSPFVQVGGGMGWVQESRGVYNTRPT